MIVTVINNFYLPKIYGEFYDTFQKNINLFMYSFIFILLLKGLVFLFYQIESYYFHIPNPTHWVVVQKSQYGGPYPDDYYVALTNSLGQEKEETVVDHITDENVVLKTVSALAKKYKKQLTDTRMKESVKEKK